MTTGDAWQELVEKDDRTSPEEYPDMALIKRDELRGYMLGAASQAGAAVAAVTQRMQDDAEAIIRELEGAASAAIEAIDKYNEENGTALCGGALFGLAKAITPARAYLAQVAS